MTRQFFAFSFIYVFKKTLSIINIFACIYYDDNDDNEYTADNGYDDKMEI